jgi:hypothetical protein
VVEAIPIITMPPRMNTHSSVSRAQTWLATIRKLATSNSASREMKSMRMSAPSIRRARAGLPPAGVRSLSVQVAT